MAPVSSLRTIFDEHDTDRCAALQLAQFQKLVAHLGSTRSESQLASDFATLERTSEGRVDFTCFVRWWEVRSAFDRYDEDGNGVIDLVEFRHLLADLGDTRQPADIEADFDTLDRDEDGLLSYFEFAQWWKIRNAFDHTDRDDDGVIDLAEFRQLVATLGGLRNPAQVEEDFNLIDRDEGGLLDFAEFAHWWSARSAFDRTDRDRRGTIDRIEFCHLMTALGSSETVAKADFETIEHDEHGRLTFPAFIRWWKARKAFTSFDKDASGAIDLKEFRQLAAELGITKSAAEVEADFDAIDRDEDGLLTFSEFARWWQQQDKTDAN